ncbi:MerR family transcriptional regulator [Clostridium septicum]|uniref:MerR family transcriptional regulator n=1 Tax=Clostridium septicum TaxID=1504 RepID=UPI0009F6747C|nr:MerR family transcriptional regulator [Clostridium septicum]
MYKIKEVATMAGISVRTLHYYDEINLLKPNFINKSGYRVYSKDDIERLHQILFFKELSFSLNEIKNIVNNPNFDKVEVLKIQKELLLRKRNRLDEIINSISDILSNSNNSLDYNERFKVFNMKEIEEFKKKYEKEVREKYPKKIVDECNKKTNKYNKDDWKKIQDNADEIFNSLAKLMDSNPSCEEVQNLIEEYRNHITSNFYQCTIEIYRGLGELYVTDERFIKFYDKYKKDLANFIKEAIDIYCNKN